MIGQDGLPSEPLPAEESNYIPLTRTGRRMKISPKWLPRAKLSILVEDPATGTATKVGLFEAFSALSDPRSKVDFKADGDDGRRNAIRTLRIFLGKFGWNRPDVILDKKNQEAEINAAIEADPKSAENWQRLLRWQRTNHENKSKIDATVNMMEAHGIDPKAKVVAADRHLADAWDSLLEATDEQLDAIDEMRNGGVLLGIKTDADVKKKWKRTIARIRELLSTARACLSIYILYVGRSQIGKSRLKNTNFPEGTKRFGLLMTTMVHLKMDSTILNADRGQIQAPPRHGKSQRVQLAVGYRLGRDHDLRIAYCTGKKEDAQDRRDYMYSIFNPSCAMGRRHRAVFPDSVLDWSREARQAGLMFQVRRDSSAVQPSFQASPFEAFVDGRGYDWIIFDDILSANDRDQQTTRENHRRRFSASWMQRMDPGAQATNLCYPWHEEDACQSLKRDPSWVCRLLPIGDNFEPLIPEIRDRAWLKREHDSPGGETNFIQQYWLRAVGEGQKIVSSLRYYDQDDRQLADILDGVEKPSDDEPIFVYLSVDPSGSDDKNSCYTAVVRGVLFRHRLFITSARRDRLDPKDNEKALAEMGCDPSVGMDLMLIEGVSGYKYLFVHLEKVLGPKRIKRTASPWKSKATRLRNVASVLQSGRVLFKGRKYGGEFNLEIAPDLAWLAAEILNVSGGVNTGFMDGADATVQLIAELEDELTSFPDAETEPDGLTERQRKVRAYEARLFQPPEEEDEGDIAELVGWSAN